MRQILLPRGAITSLKQNSSTCNTYTLHRTVHKVISTEYLRAWTRSQCHCLSGSLSSSPLSRNQSNIMTDMHQAKCMSIEASPLSPRIIIKKNEDIDDSPLSKSPNADNLEQGDAFSRLRSKNLSRQMRMHKKQSHEHLVSSSDSSSNALHGYKYRLLKTSQLTNEFITLPAPQEDTHTMHAESLLNVKEPHNIQQFRHLVGEYDKESLKVSQQLFPNSTNDVISSQWWRNLYENIRYGNKRSRTKKLSSQSFRQSLQHRRSSLLLEEMINNDSYTGSLPDERQQQEKDESDVAERIRVRSVQVAGSIDVVAVLSKVFRGGKPQSHPLAEFFETSPINRHVFGRTNVIIQLSPPPADRLPSLSSSVPRYVAVYRFGSVVFFNVSTKEASLLLEQIKKHAVQSIPAGFERREHFEIALQPQLETAAGKITADRALVRELDMNTVSVVSNIMAQTVALDWHLDTVDELLRNFSDINSSVERTGNFTSMERHTLFKVVASNNSLFIEMVGKMGIKDRSDTAWFLSQYEDLHEGMRKEFDLDERFRVSVFH